MINRKMCCKMGRWTTDYSSSIHTNTLVSEKIGPVIMHVHGRTATERMRCGLEDTVSYRNDDIILTVRTLLVSPVYIVSNCSITMNYTHAHIHVRGL